MRVERVKDVTTAASEVQYEVTLRIGTTQLSTIPRLKQAFEKELFTQVLRAINGIALYPYETESLQ